MTAAVHASIENATLLDTLIASFSDAGRTPADVASPAVILWPDPERRWQALVPRLRETFAHAYSYGTYEPETRTGPSVWLRCIVDRSLPGISPPRDVTPVLYLPGVSRQLLRAGAECPTELQPLIELQFRGRVWHQPNGQEWTVEAFLTSRIGLGLDLSRDAQTRDAVHRTLALLADADLADLRGRRLHAADFDALAVEDPVRDLLRWMNDGEGARRALDDVRWQSLASRTRAQLDFDPVIDPPLDAADRIIVSDRKWDAVWNRFSENPRLYPGVARLLREADVARGDLAFDSARRPRANDDAEAELSDGLHEAASLPHHLACKRVTELEARHGARRALAWAQLGESPLAMALEPLARLAQTAESPLAGNDVETMASEYAARGWTTDAAALDAIASVPKPVDAEVVNRITRALYLPWLDASARHFQRAMAKGLRGAQDAVMPERDVCILFADGLRFDAGAALARLLDSRGVASRLSYRLAAIPTATPTAKPAVSPVAVDLTGRDDGGEFTPIIRDTGQSVSAERLRALMTQRGVTVIADDELRAPTSDAGGWTECGEIDALGHKIGLRLARQLGSELEQIADRVTALLDAGWVRVRVVTDHGWLLVPGDLPKVEIPKSVTATRWARCALVSGESTTDMPVFPWHWNSNVRITSPHGAASFIAGYEYAHGGVSPQECVIPELLVQRGAAIITPTIVEVKWTRLRCRVTVKDAEGGSRVDIRANWKDASTSIVAALKAPDSEGQVSVVVPDDAREGAAAVVVLLDNNGKVVARATTTVGGDS
jgi:hypothetical protein